MSIYLTKKTGINLKKGSQISLVKEGKDYSHICIGLNWGVIKTKYFFGLFSESEDVDLDGSVAIYNKKGKRIDLVYYGSLRSNDRTITHSGDDRQGDSIFDDLDNEIIEIDLTKISPQAHQLVFFITSYKGQDFASIPYSKIRVFEGNKTQVKEVLATFNLSSERNFAGHTAMVMGKMVRQKNGSWEFKAIGEPISKLQGKPIMYDSLDTIEKNHL